MTRFKWGLPVSGRTVRARQPDRLPPDRTDLSQMKAVTPFQRKVYEAILRIPKGEVRSYAEVARMIGSPRAARAVGQALKRNRWAPQIPCHRVVSSNGTLGGYSAKGGLAGKSRLLLAEKTNLYNK